jgi:hypothetical protein
MVISGSVNDAVGWLSINTKKNIGRARKLSNRTVAQKPTPPATGRVGQIVHRQSGCDDSRFGRAA